MFFKLIKMHLLVSKLYIYQNARCKDKTKPVRFVYAVDCLTSASISCLLVFVVWQWVRKHLLLPAAEDHQCVHKIRKWTPSWASWILPVHFKLLQSLFFQRFMPPSPFRFQYSNPSVSNVRVDLTLNYLFVFCSIHSRHKLYFFSDGL